MSTSPFETLKDYAYRGLLELIVEGELALDSKIDERTISERLSVSRTPLREAISKLVKEGIVEHRAYRGNFVRKFTSKQVSDLYEVRKALEVLAIRLAVSSLSDEGLDELVAILGDIDAALERQDLEQFNSADARFHETIARLSGNETLVDSLNRLGLQIRIMRNIANRDPGVVERTAQERPHILQALRARDADLAGRLMAEHIEGVRRSVVEQLEAHERSEGEEGAEDDATLTPAA